MGIELFERAAEARGRLLRVDALCATGHELASPLRAAGYLIVPNLDRIPNQSKLASAHFATHEFARTPERHYHG